MSPVVCTRPRAPSLPLTDGADVSWIPGAKVGDHQGQYGSCAFHTNANWVEIVMGGHISDTAIRKVYVAACKETGRSTKEGFTQIEAHRFCSQAGWFGNRPNPSLRRWMRLGRLKEQPLIGTFRFGKPFTQARRGVCDHRADPASEDYHAMLIVGAGTIKGRNMVVVQNSHGIKDGDRALYTLEDWLFQKVCVEIYEIVKGG